MRREFGLSVVFVAACLASSCQRDPARTPEDPCAKAKQHGAVAWIADDYPAALQCARARRQPLVIDLWAPWCHTCLSMQTTVFADASLAPRAASFVFAAFDTDRAVNASVVEKFPLSAWPTFYVISPDERVLARFVGAASITQFQAFLDTGARAMTGGVTGAEAHLLAAERHLQADDLEATEAELTRAVTTAPANWARRPDALVSLIGTRRKLGDHDGCLALAEQWLEHTGHAASASDFLYHAIECAKEKESTLPDRVRTLRDRAVTRWQQLLADPAAVLSVDDRSDAMANLRTVLDTLDRHPAAVAIAEQQRELLDRAAAAATTPMEAMTYNWPRAEVYVYLGRPLELVPALEKSVHDLPKEYDPPARLGWILWKGGKLTEAARWTDAAVLLAYGPRKVRVLTQRAEIARLQGDREAERVARAAIVKALEGLPPSQVQPETLAKARQALAELEKHP